MVAIDELLGLEIPLDMSIALYDKMMLALFTLLKESRLYGEKK
jgi:hypothetical protein